MTILEAPGVAPGQTLSFLRIGAWCGWGRVLTSAADAATISLQILSTLVLTQYTNAAKLISDNKLTVQDSRWTRVLSFEREEETMHETNSSSDGENAVIPSPGNDCFIRARDAEATGECCLNAPVETKY